MWNSSELLGVYLDKLLFLSYRGTGVVLLSEYPEILRICLV